MKYLDIVAFDDITNALNFDTVDCHIIGGCDLYITKAARADKKLYKNIEQSLEAQYASLLSFSASLPPDQAGEARASLNLSRASPFGSFSQISSRRTYAYLIATLNASHPDYDFSNSLRPTDFRREKSIRRVMESFDATMNSLRPRYSSSFQEETYHKSSDLFLEEIPQVPFSDERWNPRMWQVIDKEMSLKDCSAFSYEPDANQYDGDESALWTFNYFFFNKAKKRVCYLYLKALSILDSTPPPQTPVKAKRPASGTWSLDGEAFQKKIKYWRTDYEDDVEYVGDEDEGPRGYSEEIVATMDP